MDAAFCAKDVPHYAPARKQRLSACALSKTFYEHLFVIGIILPEECACMTSFGAPGLCPSPGTHY